MRDRCGAAQLEESAPRRQFSLVERRVVWNRFTEWLARKRAYLAVKRSSAVLDTRQVRLLQPYRVASPALYCIILV